MLQTRTLRVVFVRESRGVGINLTEKPDKIVQYSGTHINVTP